MDPMLEQIAKDLINTNEDVAIQVLADQLRIKVPVITFEDMIQKEIRRSPELLNRLTEYKVNRVLRGGGSEGEIAEEYFGLAIKLVEWKETGRWSDVAEKAVTSGELRKTLEVITTAWSSNRQPLNEEIPSGNSINQGDTAPKPHNPEIDSTGLDAVKPVASASEESLSNADNRALGPKEPERLNGNQPKRKRRDSSELSPEDREKRLRIIMQPISVKLDKTNGSEPVVTFVPETQDEPAIEK